MKPITILIVEDELIVAHSLREALQDDGYEVLSVVDSAPAATRALEQTKPDLVLLDITLKGPIDGISLGQEIQQRYGIPIVYLTAYSDPETLERAKKTNPYGYLLKPYRVQELKVTIEIALHRYREERDERKHLQEEATIARKLKQEFLTNIKHEIRTPMNAIQGFCQLLQYEIQEEPSRSYIVSILESGNVLMKTLEDIIELSRLESGDMERSFQCFDPRSLLSEVGQMASAKAREKNIALVTAISPDLPPLIFDELALKRILSKLLDNAIKFTERGRVTIEADCRAVEPERAIELTISVRDTGIGIAESDRARVFEPFSQADSGLTRHHGGIGCGLAIARGLTEYLGGRLELESEEGEGSLFRLVFPRVEIVKDNEWIDRLLAIPTFVPTRTTTPHLTVVRDLPAPEIELLEHLRVREREIWPKITDTAIVGEIREFARELQRLGREYHYLPLQEYADLLLKQSLEFDLEVVKTLAAFPDITCALAREFE
ncbi:ATP-binding protein [Pannus brasiliensis CCIBt3594]|uniref:histidine kinase n=1 Tax=Pannus brasiliensis CCIBt3594 TaxID=1427578 RepID=A0AAW9R0N0_9CHRO